MSVAVPEISELAIDNKITEISSFDALKNNIFSKLSTQGDTVSLDLDKYSFLMEKNEFSSTNNLESLYNMIIPHLKESAKQLNIINFPVEGKLSDIGNTKIDSIISFDAIIKTIPNNTDPLMLKGLFECRCVRQLPSHGDFFKPPEIPFCPECGKPMDRNVSEKEYTDIKIITVEEPPEDFITSNSQPITLKCLLKGDSARNKVVLNPGDKVSLLGILKIKEIKVNRKTKEVYILDVLGIQNIDKNFHNLELTDQEKEVAKDLNENNDMFELLSSSILPDFIGNKPIKKAILCQLLSHSPGPKRGNIHILLAGDPGLNKSQILLRIKDLVPKSAYCVGGSMTVGGLIGIVNRDEITGQWTADAGLLTKCHKGLLCIDEVDKLQRESLGKFNESLENEQATITKANLNVCYPAETMVLAAMNPKKGHFDMYEDANKQINIPDSFMDRFDLIFIMQDIVDQKKDILILNTILNGKDENASLSDETIIKYVAYAKQEIVDPELNDDAKRTVSEYYNQLRKKQDPVKIHNARDIEALMRLSKSIARVYLRNQVMVDDVNKAIGIYEDSLNSFILKERVGQSLDTVEDILCSV